MKQQEENLRVAVFAALILIIFILNTIVEFSN